MKLSDILDAMPNSVTSTDLCFMSIKEANQAIEGPSGKLGGGGYYRRVAEYVLDEGNGVFGTTDEHFNFITAYLSRGDYFTALRLSTHALKTYPHGVDLLSCALRAAAGCGRFDLCQSYLEQAEQIPRRYWGWRLFFFAIEYYQSYLESCDLSQIEETLDKALAMAHDYQDYFPTDERGYDKEAELCLFANRRDDAQRILEHAVFGMVDAGDGVRTSIVAAQCCVTLLEKVLADSTDYRLIIKIAQRGIRNTTQKQPACGSATSCIARRSRRTPSSATRRTAARALATWRRSATRSCRTAAPTTCSMTPTTAPPSSAATRSSATRAASSTCPWWRGRPKSRLTNRCG